MMTFSEALLHLKSGQHVTRDAWRGHQSLGVIHPHVGSAMNEPYIFVLDRNGTRVPWVPAQVDLFAEDWLVERS